VEGQCLKMEVRFKKPFEGIGYAGSVLTDLEDGRVKISHTFSGRSKFPMNAMNLMMGKLVGRDMQKNLDNIKNNLEKV
jgi:hypothetical protein